MATVIHEGSTLRASLLADGGFIGRSGSDLVAYTRAEFLAIIQAAITDGTLPIVLTAADDSTWQLAVDAAGAMDNVSEA